MFALIKVITNKDYDKVLKLSEYAFQFTISDGELEAYKRKLDKQYILGEFENDELRSKLHIYTFETIIQNQVFKMGGVASVASWPESRRNGKVKMLLQE